MPTITVNSTQQFKSWLDPVRTSTARLYRGGVLVATGTDRPSLPDALHDELNQLVQSGLTPLEAIRAATFDAARVLRTEGDLGSVEEGKIADILILDADPTVDIENTRKIAIIIQGGKVIEREALKRP